MCGNKNIRTNETQHKYIYWKEKNKLSLFVEIINVYVQSLKEYTKSPQINKQKCKHLLELRSELNNVQNAILMCKNINQFSFYILAMNT